MMLCNNSIVASVIGVFVCTHEYANICDFACVTPFASKRRCLVTKFITIMLVSFMFVDTVLILYVI